MIGLGAITIAERKYAQHGAPVYMYIFTHESDMLIPGTQHKLGAAHALEIPYKFNLVRPADQNSEANRPGPDMMAISDPDSVQTAHNMSEMWSTFARTGHPNAKGQPTWPAYTMEKRATMEINAQCTVVDDPYSLERKLWESLEP
jgi:para-nitrobenzyl esterase